MKGLNNLAMEIHKAAREKGFYDKERNPLELHMLIVSEVAEATEAVRRNKPDFYLEGAKPEGQATELVDALVRILDVFAYNDWDLEHILETKLNYNKTRPYRHGGKAY